VPFDQTHQRVQAHHQRHHDKQHGERSIGIVGRVVKIEPIAEAAGSYQEFADDDPDQCIGQTHL
jgi:hypothetical protein